MNRITSLAISLGIALIAVPTTAQSAESAADKKQKRFLTKLKQLPNGRSAPAKVKRFTVRLVKLDPRRTKRYYKIATLKYAVAFVERKAALLSRIVQRIVGRSDLAPALQRRIDRQVRLIEQRIVQFNEPTPTPYQG